MNKWFWMIVLEVITGIVLCHALYTGNIICSLCSIALSGVVGGLIYYLGKG